MLDTNKIRIANLLKIRERFSSNAELARAISRAPQQVNDMMKGKKSFGNKIARDIEEALKLPSGFLDEAHELEGTKLAKGKKIPLLSFVQCGDRTDCGDQSYDEWLDVGECTPENAFALYINGQSMEPVFHEGEIVIVYPDVSPRPGDYVIARFVGTNETTMKQYAVTGIDKAGRDIFELRPLNPLFPHWNSQDHQIEIQGVVVECRKKFR